MIYDIDNSIKNINKSRNNKSPGMRKALGLPDLHPKQQSPLLAAMRQEISMKKPQVRDFKNEIQNQHKMWHKRYSNNQI